MKNNQFKKIMALTVAGVISASSSKVVSAANNSPREVNYEFVPTITLIKNANVRFGASLNSPIAYTFPVGTQIKLISEYLEWYEVEINNLRFFVSKTCAVVTTQSQVNNNVVKYASTNDYANLYSDASYNNYIGVIPPNVRVETYMQDGNFIFIKYNNQVGFIERARLYNYVNDNYNNGVDNYYPSNQYIINAYDNSEVNVYNYYEENNYYKKLTK